MKKFVALLLVVVMVGVLGATALADGIIDAVEFIKFRSDFKSFSIFNIIFEGLKNVFSNFKDIFGFVQEFVNRIEFKNILNRLPKASEEPTPEPVA